MQDSTSSRKIKIGFVGSREFNTPLIEVAKKIETVVIKLVEKYEIFIPISGGAKGADILSEKICEAYGQIPVIFEPDWKKYGKGAGMKRNTTIVDNSDILIAFWDGKSNGTADSITKAQHRGIPVKIIKIN